MTITIKGTLKQRRRIVIFGWEVPWLTTGWQTTDINQVFTPNPGGIDAFPLTVAGVKVVLTVSYTNGHLIVGAKAVGGPAINLIDIPFASATSVFTFHTEPIKGVILEGSVSVS